MLVLGIESSCDETAAAVVRTDGEVLSDVIASQIEIHSPYGGVVPELASRSHLRAIGDVVDRAVAVLPNGLDDVEAVAVTNGPGLIGALLVGVQFAKAVAWANELPIVGVNHLLGHMLSVFLERPNDASSGSASRAEFPFIALLASGGHTALYHVRGVRDISQLGQTRDDAAGEAFDKVAKLLGLGYPGGPKIDALAARGEPSSVKLPIPMRSFESLEFSFSGLKTAVAHHVAKNGLPRSEDEVANLCAAFQHSVVESLLSKSFAACSAFGVRRLVLAGGVAANRGLRARAMELAERHAVTVHLPSFASCTDNGAMIAYAGAALLELGVRDDVHLDVYSRSTAFGEAVRVPKQRVRRSSAGDRRP